MSVDYVRPRVNELVYQLYGRPLHPELFDILAAGRELVTMGEHARRASAARDSLRVLAPAFPA